LVPARVRRGGRVEQSSLACGCEIEGAVHHSVLSPGVRVEAGAVVENSVLFNRVHVGRHCHVRNAIIDKETVLGDQSRVGVEHADGRDEESESPVITLVGKQVRTPPNYSVCAGCVIPFGTGPADLPPSPLTTSVLPGAALRS
jgi:glucose-1-phosphate adenylyltransferase